MFRKQVHEPIGSNPAQGHFFFFKKKKNLANTTIGYQSLIQFFYKVLIFDIAHVCIFTSPGKIWGLEFNQRQFSQPFEIEI